MAEQKAKPATKKVAAPKAASAVAGKPKTAKAALAAPPKKMAAKKTATAAVKPKTTKTPAAKKAVAPAATKKAPVKKAVITQATPTTKKTAMKLSPEERYCMVQTAAYFIAERNGFCGCSADHWVAAELEIADRLGQ